MITKDAILELREKFPKAYEALHEAWQYAKQQHDMLLSTGFRDFINDSREVKAQVKKLLVNKGFIEENGSPNSGLIQVLTTLT